MSDKGNKLVDDMFDAGVHYGYSRSKRHPSMKRAVYGVKNNVEIIDLEKTVDALDAAEQFAMSLAKEGKKILFFCCLRLVTTSIAFPLSLTPLCMTPHRSIIKQSYWL